MSTEQPKYKACKHCQKDFLQNEIFNHQRSCTFKSKENSKQMPQQPEMNVQEKIQQPQVIQFQQSQQNQNDQHNQIANIPFINYSIPERFKGKVTILDVKQVPKDEYQSDYQEQPLQYTYQQPQQEQFQQNTNLQINYEQPKYYTNKQQQFNQQPYQEQPIQYTNQKPYQEQPKQYANLQTYQEQIKQQQQTNLQTYQEQPKQYSNQQPCQEKPQNLNKNNQYNLANLTKCDYCNCFINSSDMIQHEMNCSSYINLQDIINEENQHKSQQSQEQQKNSKEFVFTKNQQIIAEYLYIYQNNKNILSQGKKLLDAGFFKRLKFKKTFDQRNCYFCKDYFKEEEIIYNLQCCLIKCHTKCLHKQITKSTKCYNCQKSLFSSKVQLNK